MNENSKVSWQEIESQFNQAADHLEGVFGKTIRICDLFGQLQTEILKTCEADDQFFTRTSRSLETLNLLTQVSNTEDIPPEALLRAAQLFMQAQYMLSIIERVLDFATSTSSEEVSPITHSYPSKTSRHVH